MDKYEQLKKIIKESENIVVFTGAGISVPSGIPDFRSADGIYNQKTNTKYSPEELVSHSCYINDKELFFDFYKNKLCYPNAKPNLAHQYFADLEKSGKRVIVVTQNIDGFHQKAGNSIVYELHGSIHRNYCQNCGKSFNLDYILETDGTPICNRCGGDVKPDVVLYEEGLDEDIINRAINAIMTSDTMIIIGTSLMVYPAASFVRYFRGHNLIVINKSITSMDKNADLVLNEDIVEVIKKIK